MRRVQTWRHLQSPAALVLCLLGAGLTVSFLVDSKLGAPSANVASAVGLAAAFFVTRLLTIRLPQGDEVHATVMVGLVGLALVPTPLLVASALAAGIVDVLARLPHSTMSTTSNRLLDALRGAAVLGLMSPWQTVLHPLTERGIAGDIVILWSLLAGATYALVDMLTAAAQQSITRRLPLKRSVSSLFSSLSTVYGVHIPMAAVVLRLEAATGGWPFAPALLLTLILQNSFNLYMGIRRAYSETITALAHAAELDRPDDSGHCRRVADLAVAVGRCLGLSSRELERVGYAALLHDIGRMGKEDAVGLHAQRGAEIVKDIPFLSEVAPLISRMPPDDAERDGGIGWTIVRACSRYDRRSTDVGPRAALDDLAGENMPEFARVYAALEGVVLAQDTT